MKNLFLSIALLLCSILLLPNIANATCPPEGNGGTWTGPAIGYIEIDGCIFEYYYCFRENSSTDLHEVAITKINIMQKKWPEIPRCHPDIFYINPIDVTNEILKNIILKLTSLGGAWYQELDELPRCPDMGWCVLRVYDMLCFLGFEWVNYEDEMLEGKWEMVLCDNNIRSCSETVYFCWDWVDGVQEIFIIRYGFPIDECNPLLPCQNNCN